jgi:hypothetical protein
MIVMMSRGYVYVHVCCFDRAGQSGESGSLRREGWGDGRGYSDAPRLLPPPMLIKDHTILAPMVSLDLY